MMGKVGLVAVSLAMGAIFHYFHIPIPWTLGGILGALLVQFAPVEHSRWKSQWRNYALVVVGYGTGRYVTPAVLEEALRQWPGIIGATVVAVAVSIFISICMAKFEHMDFHSVLMGIMPGGFTQMTAMIDEDPRVDANVVTVYQSLRLIVIVMSVPIMVVKLLGADMSANAGSLAVHDGFSFWYILPFAFVGGVIFQKLKLATPYLLGPIVVTALAALVVGKLNSPPSWLLAFAQINIGMYVGTGLDTKQLKALVKTLPGCFAGIGLILGVSVAFAYLLSHLYHFSIITAFLAMSPGGLGEMCLTGMSIGANVAIIMTYQLFRFFFLSVVVPVGMRRYFGVPGKEKEELVQ